MGTWMGACTVYLSVERSAREYQRAAEAVRVDGAPVGAPLVTLERPYLLVPLHKAAGRAADLALLLHDCRPPRDGYSVSTGCRCGAGAVFSSDMRWFGSRCAVVRFAVRGPVRGARCGAARTAVGVHEDLEQGCVVRPEVGILAVAAHMVAVAHDKLGHWRPGGGRSVGRGGVVGEGRGGGFRLDSAAAHSRGRPRPWASRRRAW